MLSFSFFLVSTARVFPQIHKLGHYPSGARLGLRWLVLALVPPETALLISISPAWHLPVPLEHRGTGVLVQG